MPDYKTPQKHFLELHFPRSRFNTEMEDTLLLSASKIVELGTTPKSEFKEVINAFLRSIRSDNVKEKTIDNHRTEILTKLLGLVKVKDDEVIVGNRTLLLVKTQDIPRFFKSICNKLQFPSGINKIQFIEKYVSEGVRFKPAQYLIKLLRAGNKETGKAFAVTAKEVAQLVFNDRRVTVGQEKPEDRIKLFLELRRKDILCDGTGDVIRYARDFLNFMTAANLLIEFDKKYFLNGQEKVALDFIDDDTIFFDEFDLAKQGNVVEREEIKEVLPNWDDYYADADFFEEEALRTTLSSFSKTTVEITGENNETQIVTTGYDLPEGVKEFVDDTKTDKQTTKQIGDEGEVIVYNLEKNRVNSERPDLLGLVRIVSNDTSLGFDIQSVFESGLKKYIEVKTTKRNFTPDFNTTSFFGISSNAWDTAQQLGDSYFIARVIIAKEKISVFVIQNPAQKYQENKIKLLPLEYRLTYTEDAGEFIVKDRINI